MAKFRVVEKQFNIAEIEQASKNSAFPADFLWFWSEYPKKKAKLDALKAWRQTASLRPPIEELIAALDLQAQADDWHRDGGAYIPWPAKWLRQGYWENE